MNDSARVHFGAVRHIDLKFRIQVHGEFRNDHFPHFGIREASSDFVLDLLQTKVKPDILEIQVRRIYFCIFEQTVGDQF